MSKTKYDRYLELLRGAREKWESANTRFNTYSRSVLYRADGQPRYTPQEHAEALERELQPLRTARATIESAVAEARAEAQRRKNLAAYPSWADLTTDEATRARALADFAREDIERLDPAGLVNTLRLFTDGTGDKVTRYLLARLVPARLSAIQPTEANVRQVNEAADLLKIVASTLVDPARLAEQESAAALEREARNLDYESSLALAEHDGSAARKMAARRAEYSASF